MNKPHKKKDNDIVTKRGKSSEAMALVTGKHLLVCKFPLDQNRNLLAAWTREALPLHAPGDRLTDNTTKVNYAELTTGRKWHHVLNAPSGEVKLRCNADRHADPFTVSDEVIQRSS